jgi:hypothetical protein
LPSRVANRKLYEAPEGTQPPPFWIRALLLLTCTGVSFAHGSNDGQKGMGLIMLILIGTVPTAYALNHAVTKKQSQDFVAVSEQAANTLNKYVSPNAVIADARDEVTTYVRTKEFTPNTMLALRQLVSDIGNETVLFGELSKVPNDRVRNFRNDMYLVSEALRLMQKTNQPEIAASDWQILSNYKKHIDNATKFIPLWVKVAVAMALGPRDDGGLEAYRRDRRRKDWQRSSDLRTRRGRGNYSDGDHRRRRLVRPAGEHDPRAFIRDRRHDGGESHRAAMGDGTQSPHGLGTDAARLDDSRGLPVLGIPKYLLGRSPEAGA